MHGQQNIKPRNTVGHGMLNKQNQFIMCNNFTDTTGLGQYNLASKPDVLSYSASFLLPAGGVQSVQRTEGTAPQNQA